MTSAEKHLSTSVESAIKQIAGGHREGRQRPVQRRQRRHRRLAPFTGSVTVSADVQAKLDAALAAMKAGTADHLPGQLRRVHPVGADVASTRA